MFALPHSAIAGARWPAIPQTPAAAHLALQQQLSVTERLPAEELRRLQFLQIAELVAHIDRAVPFYGVSLRKAGLKPGEPITGEAWARVPILTRRAVQEAGDKLYARELPPGHGKTTTVATSGSSGMPVRIAKTDLHQFYWDAFYLREELWHGRDFLAKGMAIRRDEARTTLDEKIHIRRMADWGTPISTVYPSGPSLLLDYRSTVADQVEVLLAERPVYFTVYPSILLEILRHCRARGIKIEGVAQVRTVREALAAETRALTREIFGAEIVDIYSAAETGNLAIQCPEQGAYHAQSESTLVEILNEANRACMPGEIGRVVVTPLHNFAMPLIRYEIGDLAEAGASCSCGRTLPVIARILGRARDMLTLPNGEKRYPYYGHNALVRVTAIRQHQVVQKSRDEIEIRLVLSRPLTAEEDAHIRAAALEGLGHPFKLTLTECDEIKRSPEGKYAEFRSEI